MSEEVQMRLKGIGAVLAAVAPASAPGVRYNGNTSTN